MTRCRFIVLILLATPFSLTCNNSLGPGTQPSWSSVALPGGGLYREIVFKNHLEGWVVGDSGRILHTLDGGSTWNRQASGTGLDLSCISFADTRTGLAGGASGIILGTTDAGGTWITRRLPDETTGRFMGLTFSDGQTCWAVSNRGKILHTADAGATWESQASGTQWAITSLCFADARRGWAVTTNREILGTSDAGMHWDVKTLPIRAPLILTDLFFFDEERGWIATNVLASSAIETGSPLISTTDGGATWSAQSTLPVLDIEAVWFVDRNAGWLAGDNTIFKTSDGGLTWIPDYQTNGAIFVSMTFADENHGWVLGASGQVLRYEAKTPKAEF